MNTKYHDTPFFTSENYIFGKFDTFCRRLDKISKMIATIQAYAGLADVRIEGIETIFVRYKTIVEATKKKNYDILDHRKGDFDSDYIEFCRQFDNLKIQLQNFVDTWFERSLTVSMDASLMRTFSQLDYGGVTGSK